MKTIELKNQAGETITVSITASTLEEAIDYLVHVAETGGEKQVDEFLSQLTSNTSNKASVLSVDAKQKHRKHHAKR